MGTQWRGGGVEEFAYSGEVAAPVHSDGEEFSTPSVQCVELGDMGDFGVCDGCVLEQ